MRSHSLSRPFQQVLELDRNGLLGRSYRPERARVITDDDFASIVAPVEEGRGITTTSASLSVYLLAGNAGELAVVLVAVLVGWPLPVLPIQLLWINLVTDGLPALALATDPVDTGVLERPPRPATAELMDRAPRGNRDCQGLSDPQEDDASPEWEGVSPAFTKAGKNLRGTRLLRSPLPAGVAWYGRCFPGRTGE